MGGLLEREALLKQLREAAGRVTPRAGQVVLLRGEAGVGKTAALRRFLGSLDDSWRILTGWCDPLAVPRPLGPLIDVLAGFDGGLSRRLAAAVDAGDTSVLYRMLVGAFSSGGRWVWVIEDAHWADGASLDLLRFLVRRIGALPVLLVVSYREDLDNAHPLLAVLGDVATSAAVIRLRVAPLSSRAVADLAAGSGVNAEQLYRLTAGNAFFVTEILAAGPGDGGQLQLPRSVSEVVGGRLARLTEPARQTAYATAVCGPRLDIDLLGEIYHSAATGLDECLATGVLVTAGRLVSFRHELARRAALDQIPGHRRQQLHARAMAALGARPITPDVLGTLAFHADQIGDSAAVTSFGVAGAEQAAALGASREAADLYALVLNHADAVPVSTKVRWAEQHALACYLCGLGESAVASWREASRWRQELADPLGESENLRWLAHGLWALGRLRAAAEAASQAVAVAQQTGPTSQLGWALVTVAEVGAWSFGPGAREHAAKAAQMGRRLGDDVLVLRARGAAAWIDLMRTGTGWEELESVWRDAMACEVVGDNSGIISSEICWLAVLHYSFERSDHYLAVTREHCRDRNLVTFEAFARVCEAMVAVHRGDWQAASALAEDVLTRPGLTPMHRLVAQVALALVRARRGERTATELLDAAGAGSEPGHLLLFSMWAARAEAAWLADDDAAVLTEVRAGLAAAVGDCDPWLIGQLRRWERLAGGGTEIVDIRTPFDLELRGEWQAAAADWAQRGCDYDAALARLSGDADAVAQALETFRGLGARAAARRAQRLLAQRRGRTPRSRRVETLADPDGLTGRQREIVQLLATGSSDADIASALHISPKTVGHHIQAILSKLAVENRTQAAAHVLARGADTAR